MTNPRISTNSNLKYFLRSLLLSAILIICLGACAAKQNVRFDRYRDYLFPELEAQIHVEYTSENHWDAEFVAEAMKHAVPKVSQWGRFREPLLIRIFPKHENLEQAIERRNYPWLRGWSRFDEILLQAPSTWGGVKLEKRVRELITHELTHVVMYQTIGDADDWYGKPIPFWFREGMASFVAEQGHFRLSRIELAAYYLGEGYVGDPISEAAKIVRTHPKEVYSVGHWMFSDLVEKVGREKIVRLMRTMRQGLTFREAWLETLGFPLSEFVDDWRETLIAGGGNSPADAQETESADTGEPLTPINEPDGI